MKTNLPIILIITLTFFCGCNKLNPVTSVGEGNSADSIHQRLASAVIYEVNIRQITPEGTFKAFTEQHIDRLKNLGVDILWLMPSYPISVKNRKGTLGSYYSVADYKGVNPEFGTPDDLKDLVIKAHEAGMLVIFDWVANHSGWDNIWIKDNPDWYTKNEKGEIVAPVPDWSDVADLNYDNPELNHAMIEALEYWISEFDIDGYRCDAAAMAPTVFWKEALSNVDSLKAIIKLAEAWEPELMAVGFDAAYGWELHHLLNEIAKGRKKITAIGEYLTKADTLYAKDDMLMNFITNHDENSWAGTEYERMGNFADGFAALTYLLPGIPMIYTGQEGRLNKRLRFFEKDTVNWSDTSALASYRKLNSLKHGHAALRAGIQSGTVYFSGDSVKNIAIVVRESGNDKVVGIFNFSGTPVNTEIPSKAEAYGTYTDLFTGQSVRIKQRRMVSLKPWEYLILSKN